jgi:hypothetical protein
LGLFKILEKYAEGKKRLFGSDNVVSRGILSVKIF